MKIENTTIKISRKTKQRLDNLKEYKRESFEEVIKKILHILNQIRKDPISGNHFLEKIDENIKRKQVYDKEHKQDSTQEQQKA